MDINLPLALSARPTDNGQQLEWFFTLDGKPVYPNNVVGLFTGACQPEEAFYMVMRQGARAVNPVEEY
jgi:hypothetical protein